MPKPKKIDRTKPCETTLRGSWSGGEYVCGYRQGHYGECGNWKTVKPGVQQAPYVHTW